MHNVRPIRQEDRATTRAIARRAWQIGYAGLFPKRYLNSLGTEHEPPRPPSPDRRKPAQVAWLVAETDKVVSGAMMICTTRDLDIPADFGEVAIINVDPAYWRQGVGRTLLTAAEEWFRENSIETATLWVLAGNSRARSFYEANGWVTDGGTQTESLTPYGLPEVRYRKTLG